MVRNQALIVTGIPTGEPVVGEHLQVQERSFDAFDTPLRPNAMILETLYVSFDPYMRGLLRDPEEKSYIDAIPIGEPLIASTISKVLKSTSKDYAEGDIIVAYLPIQEYNLWTADHPLVSYGLPTKVDTSNPDLDIRHYLGALGMPGLTAYSALYEIGKPKAGETILVSSAAGAVGQLVGQIVKHEGLKVLGSVGSDEKLKFITEDLGFDGGWNYKTEKNTKEAIEHLTDGKGIDIFWDNVGGEQLDGALETMNDFGRIIACGAISQTNLPPEKRYALKNSILVIPKRLTWRGFIYVDPDMGPKHTQAHQANVKKWLLDGSLKAKIHETVGIEHAGEAFVGMLRGDNFGKAVLKVKV